MTEDNQISYLYGDDEDEKLLNFIFRKGKNNLLCICLHPKEQAEQLKSTENIEKLCGHNNYDGFVIAFLNPTVSNETMEIQKFKDEINSNHLLIGALVMKNQFRFKNVLVCWGEEIEYYNQEFFKQSAFRVLKDLDEDGLKFFCIGVDKNGNPLSVKENNIENKLKKFNFKTYNANLKRTIKIEPEITINGIEFK